MKAGNDLPNIFLDENADPPQVTQHIVQPLHDSAITTG